jgi:hypothetical protein
VSDTDDNSDNDALLSRLRLIEDQPLEARAAAFAQINDELQSQLEGGDAPRNHG